MTTRRIIQPNQLANSDAAINDAKQGMVDVSILANSVLGTSTLLVNGDVVPTGPASMTVNIEPITIFSYVVTDATQFGTSPSDLPADSNLILKYAYTTANTPHLFTAPAGGGNSQNFLIQVKLQEGDGAQNVIGGTDSLPFWAGVTNITISGNIIPVPNPPSTAATETQRIDQATISVVAGVIAPTGTQVTPAPTGGATGFAVVIIANGQTTIVSGDISVYPGAPFITEFLTDKISQATANTLYAPIVTSGTTITTSATITLGQLNKRILVDTTSGNVDLTLPAKATWPDGATIEFVRINTSSTNRMRIIGNAAETIANFNSHDWYYQMTGCTIGVISSTLQFLSIVDADTTTYVTNTAAQTFAALTLVPVEYNSVVTGLFFDTVTSKFLPLIRGSYSCYHNIIWSGMVTTPTSIVSEWLFNALITPGKTDASPTAILLTGETSIPSIDFNGSSDFIIPRGNQDAGSTRDSSIAPYGVGALARFSLMKRII